MRSLGHPVTGFSEDTVQKLAEFLRNVVNGGVGEVNSVHLSGSVEE